MKCSKEVRVPSTREHAHTAAILTSSLVLLSCTIPRLSSWGKGVRGVTSDSPRSDVKCRLPVAAGETFSS